MRLTALAAAGALTLAALPASSTATAAPEHASTQCTYTIAYLRTETNVNLRKRPHPNAAILRVIPRDHYVFSHGVIELGYHRVGVSRAAGTYGFIRPTDPATGKHLVSSGYTETRPCPGPAGETVPDPFPVDSERGRNVVKQQ